MVLERPRQKPQGTARVGIANFMRTVGTVFGSSRKPIAPRRAKPVLASKKGGLPVRGKLLPARTRFKPSSARSR